MDNIVLVEKLFVLQETIRGKDPWLAGRLAALTIPMLEFKGSLESLSQDALARIPNADVSPKVASYVHRLFQGASVEVVAKDVPLRTATILPTRRPDYSGKERMSWDGSWDNADRNRER